MVNIKNQGTALEKWKIPKAIQRYPDQKLSVIVTYSIEGDLEFWEDVNLKVLLG